MAACSRAALGEVLRRFLAAYGPTIPQAFARWWATTPATARQLFAQLGDEVAEAARVGAFFGADATPAIGMLA